MSSVRQEIVDALQSAGPCSIAELAGLLGRAPDALYFHVRQLVRVGLVVERGARKRGRHVAAMLDLPGRPLYLDYQAEIPGPHLVGVVRAALRESVREFEAALLAGVAVQSGARRTMWGGRAKGWLTGTELTRANQLIRELLDLMRSARPRRGAHALSIGFVLAPSRISPRAVRRKKPSKEKAHE